ERRHLLKGETTQKAYRLGDRVQVQVARVDLERRAIDFALVGVAGPLGGARARGARKPRGARPKGGAARPRQRRR
ncbi:MAG: hypothetical protein ACM3PV_07165, partial [Betaproteobacteria bacterium]